MAPISTFESTSKQFLKSLSAKDAARLLPTDTSFAVTGGITLLTMAMLVEWMANKSLEQKKRKKYKESEEENLAVSNAIDDEIERRKFPTFITDELMDPGNIFRDFFAGVSDHHEALFHPSFHHFSSQSNHNNNDTNDDDDDAPQTRDNRDHELDNSATFLSPAIAERRFRQTIAAKRGSLEPSNFFSNFRDDVAFVGHRESAQDVVGNIRNRHGGNNKGEEAKLRREIAAIERLIRRFEWEIKRREEIARKRTPFGRRSGLNREQQRRLRLLQSFQAGPLLTANGILQSNARRKNARYQQKLLSNIMDLTSSKENDNFRYVMKRPQQQQQGPLRQRLLNLSKNRFGNDVLPQERRLMALKLIGKPPVIRPPKAQVINVKTKKLLRKAQTAYQLKPQRLLDVVYPYGVEDDSIWAQLANGGNFDNFVGNFLINYLVDRYVTGPLNLPITAGTVTGVLNTLNGILNGKKRSLAAQRNESRLKTHDLLQDFYNITALMAAGNETFQKYSRGKRETKQVINPLMEKFVEENKEMLKTILMRDNVEDIFDKEDAAHQEQPNYTVYENGNVFDNDFFETIKPLSPMTVTSTRTVSTAMPTTTTIPNFHQIPDLFVPIDNFNDEAEEEAGPLSPILDSLPPIFTPLVQRIENAFRATTTTSTTTATTITATTTVTTAAVATTARNSIVIEAEATTTSPPTSVLQDLSLFQGVNIAGVAAMIMGTIGVIGTLFGGGLGAALNRRSDAVRPFFDRLFDLATGNNNNNNDNSSNNRRRNGNQNRRRKNKTKTRRKRPQLNDYSYDNNNYDDYWGIISDQIEKADNYDDYDYLEQLYPELFVEYDDRIEYDENGNIDLTDGKKAKDKKYIRRRGKRKTKQQHLYKVKLQKFSEELKNYLQERDEDENFLNNVGGSFNSFGSIIALGAIWWIWNAYIVGRIPTTFLTDFFNGKSHAKVALDDDEFPFDFILNALQKDFSNLVVVR